jgi:hypothetical protein
MRHVRVALRNGRPAGAVHTAGESWKIHALRGSWSHPSPATASAGQETARWRLLVEGPALYRSGQDGFFEVVVRQFAAADSWWMDTT